ncbi:MAG: terminase [Candidatus Moranbacteria bacterium]|nr:terminase [Candidatus Moranbacteria bacterium]
MQQHPEIERFLIQTAHEFRHSPLAFAQFAWDDLRLHDWQRAILSSIGDQLKTGAMTTQAAIQEAIASGHGIGKSCLVAIIILFSLATEADTKGIVTANTETQLKTKTWAELAKWYQGFRYKHWFKFTATAIYSADPAHEKTWRVDMIPWSERNTEAFAGLHNAGRRVLVIFDEASAIPDNIWEVTEGALTDEDTEILWLAFGNPTRNTGRFRECFGRLKHRWRTRQIDSRTVPGTSKEQIQQWISDYGDDSDFVRVRVKGEFPRSGSRQFISSEVVEAAIKRTVEVPFGAPKIMAVDVARFGDDQSVIARRHGRKLEDFIKYRGLDLMALASEIAAAIKKYRPDVVYVDGVGVGGGVVDRLRQLGHNIIEVNAGAAPEQQNRETHYNKRAEMWDRMKNWLDTGDIPDDRDLRDDLIGIEYSYDNKMRLQLEKKDDMKKRGLSSPDCADALSLSFYAALPPVIHINEHDCYPEEAFLS